MLNLKRIMALLLFFAMAVVGMAGAVQLSTGPKEMVDIGGCAPQDLIQGDPIKALSAFNEDVTLDRWGTGTAASEEGFYGVMPTPATENYWAMMSDEGSMLGAEAEQALDRAEEESYYPAEFRKHRMSSGPSNGIVHVMG